MNGHETEFWIEDGTGRYGWCCHTCGIDQAARGFIDAEAAIEAHEKTSPADPEPSAGDTNERGQM